jgi:tRNA G10  N-methylase Trm11
MTQTLCILGRQPALGIAELESLCGADKLRPIGATAALLDLDPPTIDFTRLGGTVKFCKLLTILDTTHWGDIQKYLEGSIPQHLQYLPEGKMKLGLSVYGLEVSVQRINATGLAIKKVIKATGRSIRVIPNNEKALNSAQVLHNQLTSALGWELIFVRDGNKTLVAQNIAEQDIEAYAARDQARPKRDAKVGMLPPKLAQIIINLAKGTAEPVKPDCGPHDPKGTSVLDPFCGTGVVLQEALLMGYDAYGTDLEDRMVDYSRENLEWLANRYKLEGLTYLLETGDATTFEWQAFDVVACETYLGRPFSAEPRPEMLQDVMSDVDTIHRKFLKNLAKQTKPGFRACLAVPAWKTKNGFKHLKVLDSLEELGYTRVSFVHAGAKDLIYHREGQIVARELVVLERK